MKAVVATFNQEKALVGAFSVIVQLRRLIVNSSSIHLDVVHAPLCEGPGVGLQVSQGAGVASAGPSAVIRINTELEPEFMDIVGQSLDARGEPGYKCKIDISGNLKMNFWKNNQFDESCLVLGNEL